MKALYTIAALLLLSTATLFGQGFETSVKLYTNINYLNSSPIPSLFGWQDRFMRFRGLTPAIHLYNDEKWEYHELEISNLSFRTTEQQLENVQELLFGFRYEYGGVLDMDIGEDFQLLLGGSARIFYYRQSITPNVSNRFGETYRETKAVFGVVPRIKYQINEQFSLDLNTIISALSVGLEHRRFDNPTLSADSNTQTNFNTNFFFLGDLTFRLGIAYHFE